MIQYTLIKFLNTWVDFQGWGGRFTKKGRGGGASSPLYAFANLDR
jgi:hypothetical protein